MVAGTLTIQELAGESVYRGESIQQKRPQHAREIIRFINKRPMMTVFPLLRIPVRKILVEAVVI
jgi:hypothetical protein